MNSPEENTSTQALHIIELRIENTKRLRAVTIRPDGRIITIGGDNDQGKSSVLESIEMGIGGADRIIEEPIRRGAKKARTVIDLGELIVTRTFTKSGSSLVVEGKDGLPKKSPQELLNRLASAVTFDPFGFTILKPDKQLEVLRGIVKLDFTAIDSARSKAFNERTLVNRDLEQSKALVARLPHHEDAPAEEESSTVVLIELKTAQSHNQSIETLRQALLRADQLVEARQKDHENIILAGAEIRDQIRVLEAKLKENESASEIQAGLVSSVRGDASKARKAYESAVPMDTTALETKLSGLESTNAKVRANKQRADAAAAVKAKQVQADALTRKIEEADEKKQALLESAKFPVAGLSFGENGVLLDGLPFSQAGDAEQIRVSVAIAAALNPRIRVMLIKDGSLIGTKKMELIRQLAEEHNLQVWIEVVSDANDKKSSVVIEDGHIAGEETPPESETAAAPDAPAVEQQDELSIPPSK